MLKLQIFQSPWTKQELQKIPNDKLCERYTIVKTCLNKYQDRQVRIGVAPMKGSHPGEFSTQGTLCQEGVSKQHHNGARWAGTGLRHPPKTPPSTPPVRACAFPSLDS